MYSYAAVAPEDGRLIIGNHEKSSMDAMKIFLGTGSRDNKLSSRVDVYGSRRMAYLSETYRSQEHQKMFPAVDKSTIKPS